MTDRFFNLTDREARAIVGGRKTVLRRPVVPMPSQREWLSQETINRVPQVDISGEWAELRDARGSESNLTCVRLPCTPGDTLIGREACRIWEVPMRMGTAVVEYRCDGTWVEHRGRGYIGGGVAVDVGHELLDYAQEHVRWRPAVQMPRAAARIVRPVLSVCVERLQDIDEEDAVREGWGRYGLSLFRPDWDIRYSRRGLGWDVSPWVWRIEVGGVK